MSIWPKTASAPNLISTFDTSLSLELLDNNESFLVQNSKSKLLLSVKYAYINVKQSFDVQESLRRSRKFLESLYLS
jgi:hypothetical protein